MAVGELAERRPAVAIEGIDVVGGVHFANDRGDVVGHVAGEHAAANQARLFFAAIGAAVGVALEPVGMGFEAIVPVEIGAHAGYDAHATLFCGGAALAEEIAIAEIFSLAMERHFCLVVGQNAGNADEDDVGFDAGPEVGP